ncbi:MAG: phosphate acyltransferase PlsX [Anaerolineales bacterium]
MRIVVDAMGSDNFPRPDVEGAVMAAREYGVEIILTGDEARIKPLLAEFNAAGLPISLKHAPEQLTMADKGMALVLKAKRKTTQNSMAIGMDEVIAGRADAFVTMGNTGAASVTAYFRMGTLPGVDRPALAAPFPTKTGICIVLDVGANPDCKPDNLVQFGVMGSIYAERVRGVRRPRVGLVSNGEEAGKGNQLIKDAYPLLANSGLNFVGNIEGKELLGGEVDVAVLDGFTGNVLLKSAEAVAKLSLETVRERIQSGPLAAKVGGMLVRPTLRSVRKLLDPSEEGAATLLGINGLVFIGHGRSDALAVKNAVRVARQAAEAGVVDGIRTEIARTLSAAPIPQPVPA